MNIGAPLLGLLVFPGLLYAIPAAWFMVWLERKALARMQGRIGPPFYQPFFDFIKLISKRPISRPGFDGFLQTTLPILAVVAVLGSLALLPVFPQQAVFIGDIILLASLLEVGPICAILAGFASRSPFGQVGATREAVLTIAYNLPFLTALVALACAAGSRQLMVIVQVTPGFVRLLAVAAILLCLPVKLRLNPFSLSNADQEIYSGPTTEFGGPQLAFWELAHGLEWVALSGLVVSLGLPWRTGIWIIDAFLFILFSLILVLLLTLLAAGTARLKLPQTLRFFWRWDFGLSVLALLVSVLPV